MLDVKKDGGWGWLVLFFVLCSQTILGGICVSSGLFYVIFMDAFNSNPVEISWLCSLPSTLWYLGNHIQVMFIQDKKIITFMDSDNPKIGPVGSILTNKYGCRACALFGGVISTVGLSIGFFATSTGYLFFSHGFLTGFGFGLNYTASMTILNKYFDKFKTMATGLASVGHNAGLVIYAKIIIYLQETYSWRGMMLIHGAITFNMCACALAMFPLKSDTSQFSCDVQGTHKSSRSYTKKRKAINLSVFRKLSFIFFCVSNVFTNTSYGIYLLHLPSYSKYVGFSRTDFGTVMIVFGLTNVVGKIIYSVLGQHPRVDVTILYTVSLAATGIFILLFPVFLTKAGMLTLAGFVGFFQSVTGALLQAVIYRIVGFERFADGVGMCLPFKAVGNLIGGPLAGFLFASTGDYSYSFYLSGVCMLVCCSFMIQPIVHHRRREKMHKNKDMYTVCEMDIDITAHSIDKNTAKNDTENVKRKGMATDFNQNPHYEKLTKEEKEKCLETN